MAKALRIKGSRIVSAVMGRFGAPIPVVTFIAHSFGVVFKICMWAMSDSCVLVLLGFLSLFFHFEFIQNSIFIAKKLEF